MKVNEISLWILGLFLLVALLILKAKPQSEAEKISGIVLDHHPMSIASNGVIEEKKLDMIRQMGYEQLKKSINAKDDFCIYIEDEQGHIIAAKGSASLRQDGLQCDG